MKTKLHIGTSGWHYKHWIGTFYPEGTKESGQLELYQQTFHTVELNNSFYHLPSLDTFKSWYAAVPADFIFSVKASRYITHMKKLKDPADSLRRFFRNAGGLGEKLGPVLFQLPPGWKVNAGRLEDFLEALPKKHKYVFEFRNETWYTDAIFELLRKHNCAFCIYELGGHITPTEVTAGFVYIRLHGPGARYQGSYSAKTLGQWLERCKKWMKQGREVFIYFDNDQEGFAAFNAKTLQEKAQRAIRNSVRW